MPKKKPPKQKTRRKPSSTAQHKRFVEAAKAVGADDNEAFERVFRRAVPPKRQMKRG